MGKMGFFKHSMVAAAIVVPFDSSQWQNLTFSKIPANKVEFSDSKMVVKVEKSASPLIFPLKEASKITKIEVSGKTNRLIEFAKDKVQGEKGSDDFVLRVGMVIPGKRTLNWAQRMVAAAWVKKLFSLAPKGSGVDHIYFLNLGQDEAKQGMERDHPLSDLIKEKTEWVIKEPGEFNLSAEFKQPKNVAALWISIDGDDTKSSFTTELSKIELTSEDSEK